MEQKRLMLILKDLSYPRFNFFIVLKYCSKKNHRPGFAERWFTMKINDTYFKCPSDSVFAAGACCCAGLFLL
jgi:hypothetical protein